MTKINASYLMLGILVFVNGINAACEYGNSPHCVHPCNCDQPFDSCTYGCTCRDGPPRGQGLRWFYNCRAGNVAFKKISRHSMNGVRASYPIVDGDITSCSVLPVTHEFYWEVDLQRSHVILNVTTFSTHLASLIGIHIKVSPEIGKGYLCSTLSQDKYDAIRSHARRWDALCGVPLRGRYITIVWYPDKNVTVTTTLCELAAVGYIIRDCSRCLPGSPCTDLDGCHRCPDGYKRPDCTTCPLNSFGPDCSKNCRCKDYKPCQLASGICDNGCQRLYIYKTCNVHLKICVMRESDLFAVNTTGTTVTLHWTRCQKVTHGSYYNYVVQVQHDGAFFTDIYSTLKWHSELPSRRVYTGIEGLLPNRTYTFRIVSHIEINTTDFNNKEKYTTSDGFSKTIDVTTGTTFIEQDTPEVVRGYEDVQGQGNASDNHQKLEQEGKNGCFELSIALGITIGMLILMSVLMAVMMYCFYKVHRKDKAKSPGPSVEKEIKRQSIEIEIKKTNIEKQTKRPSNEIESQTPDNGQEMNNKTPDILGRKVIDCAAEIPLKSRAPGTQGAGSLMQRNKREESSCGTVNTCEVRLTTDSCNTDTSDWTIQNKHASDSTDMSEF